MKFKIFSSVLNLALLGVKGLTTSFSIFSTGLLEKDVKKSSKRTTDKHTAPSADITTQELKNASKSPLPTKSIEHGIEINQLNQELQQLMIGGSQDKGGPRISPPKKVSPQKELMGYDGTPYSRSGSRKFVSRAERRHSSENPLEDVPYPITDHVKDVFERAAPSPPATVEPVNIRTAVETSQEEQTASSMSYSAVLKGASHETTKSGPAGSVKPDQSKMFSRPPPGFPPLPTHGGDTQMHMTVLSTKTKTKPPGPPTTSTAPRNTATRADASVNWRNDAREEQFTHGTAPGTASGTALGTARPTNPSQPGHAVKWRRFDDSVAPSKSPLKSGAFSEAGTQRRESPVRAMGSESSDESPAPPPVVHPHRAFGPGGLKACVICGSKDHLRCNDRSKMFMD